MTIADLERFKNLLLERESNLTSWLDTAQDVRGNDVNRVRALLKDIRSALGRVEDHSYGECRVCLGQVEHHLLEIQPAAEVCLECLSDSERQNLEEELSMASKFHRALLPRRVARVEGFEMAVKSLAARTVGGDYYDFLQGNDNSMRIVIADIMGKGLPAGLMMSNVHGAIRMLSDDIESSSKLISNLNKLLCRNLPVVRFVSMACVTLNPEVSSTAGVSYTNAGHVPPILIRSGSEIERLDPTGGVLGVHEDFEYEQRKIKLSSGDLLLLFTDGVTEEENGDGEMYGEDRLLDFMKNNDRSNPDEFLGRLLESVRQFSGSSELKDDLTVLAIKKI